jgi:hypothetical protein
MKNYLKALSISVCSVTSILASPQPNPPSWPYDETGGVKVFDASMSVSDINTAVNSAYAKNGGQNPGNNGQFSSLRYAFLFKPGNYSGVNVPVGFYTSVMGLGQAPKDTEISNVYCQQGSSIQGHGALDTFWRSAENFATTPNLKGILPDTSPIDSNTMLWAVSQASPLRRVCINGSLWLFQVQKQPDGSYQAGWASGGFMADCPITGNVNAGSQQQWVSRNCNMANWNGGAWNMVFVGCIGNIPPTSTNGQSFPINPPFIGYSNHPAFTNVAKSPVIAEKPYITFSNGLYYLQIPNVEKDKSGNTTDYSKTTSVDFTHVYVASYKDSAVTINAQIDSGNHVILTPGIYKNLNGSIVVSKPNTVILGIGFPTLIANNGNPCIVVNDNVGGVRISGILLQAGSHSTHALLQWGLSPNANPNIDYGFLYDCFARVGGPADPSINPTTADIMVQINSANVVCDNLWLWRADHWSTVNGEDHSVVNSQNPCKTAIQVNGDNIVAYGLACEHTLEDLTQWYGNKGKVYFYQSEFPYDVTQDNYGSKGYVSYKVQPHSSGSSHEAYGIGVYSFFRDNTVTVARGIATSPGSSFTNAFTRFLTGHGGITHVIDTTGLGATNQNTSYVSTYSNLSKKH